MRILQAVQPSHDALEAGQERQADTFEKRSSIKDSICMLDMLDKFDLSMISIPSSFGHVSSRPEAHVFVNSAQQEPSFISPAWGPETSVSLACFCGKKTLARNRCVASVS